MTLSERLRQETRSQHEQTEQLLYIEALKNGTLSAPAYAHLLRTHLVFHQALEQAIAGYPDFFSDYSPLLRQKTPWLETDLTSLNEPVPPADTTLFAGWSPVALLGAAYVAEGSMLGGMVVLKLLRQNPAIRPLLTHARFYQGYGSETGRYWQDFTAFLLNTGSSQPDEVVAAAQRTFALYQTIFHGTQTAISSAVPSKTT